MKNKTKNKREFILNTATSLFQIKGYSGTGLNEILKESSAPKGSLYYYFPNGKEQLALEAIKLTRNYVNDMITKRLKKYSDPILAIQNAILEIADGFYASEDELISFKSNKKVSINLIALETASTNDKLRDACEITFNSWEKLYADKLLKNGFEENEAKTLGSIIETMIEGGILMSLTKKDDKPLIDIANQIPKILKR